MSSSEEEMDFEQSSTKKPTELTSSSAAPATTTTPSALPNPSPNKTKTPSRAAKRKAAEDVIVIDSSDEEDEESEESEEEESDDEPPKKRKRPTPKKTSSATKQQQPKRSKTKNTSRHEMEFVDAQGEVAEMPKLTKKAQKERAKAKQLADQKITVFSGDVSNPIRELAGDDPVVVKYATLTADRLKDYLRHNAMISSGKKEELVQRCIDGEFNGRLTRCPRCRKGKLKWDTTTGKFSCPGFFDVDASMFLRCNFMDQVAPRDKWLDPAVDPPVPADVTEGGGGEDHGSAIAAASAEDAVTMVLTTEFQEQIKALDMKAMATAVVKQMRDMGFALPADEAKARVEFGQIYMKEAKDLAKTVMALGTKFPKPDVAAAAAAAASVANIASCRVAENEDIVAMFEEVAKLEKLVGGENAPFKIKSAKMVAMALRDLNFAVTSGAALAKPGPNKVAGLGKGSAKLIDDFLESGRTTSTYVEELKAKAAGG